MYDGAGAGLRSTIQMNGICAIVNFIKKTAVSKVRQFEIL